MKEIQGKIKFGIIPLKKEETNTFTSLDDELFDNLTNEQMDNSYMLSEITEEQAGEFVEGGSGIYADYLNEYFNIFKTAKESLISLLKANDVLIKEWKEESEFYPIVLSAEQIKQGYLEHQKLPDDLLLVKL